nr:MAG TPA: hypothetical protein [Caudoviricetes sp.]
MSIFQNIISTFDLHKFSRYSFSFIFVRYGAFYAALR